VLSQLIEQEIFYRLLTEKNGAVLFETLLSPFREKGITAAIRWIKENYAKPLDIETLARVVSMSASNLHHRFKRLPP